MSLLDDALRKLERMKRSDSGWTPIPPESRRRRGRRIFYLLPLILFILLLIFFFNKGVERKAGKFEFKGSEPISQINAPVDTIEKKGEDKGIEKVIIKPPPTEVQKIVEKGPEPEKKLKIEGKDDSKVIAQKLFQFGLIKEKAGDRKEAAKSYIEALKRDPDLLPARLNLAALYLEEGYLTEAERELNLLLKKNPSDPRVNLNMAILMIKKRKDKEAEGYLIRVLESSPENSRARLLLGSIYERNKREREAIEIYEKGLLYSENPAFHYRLGRLYDLSGDYERAIKHYRRFLETGSNGKREAVLKRLSFLERKWQNQ
jgi:tetratricopeptide (TPR) repeat protein